ncbi:MAG: hypothetical protein GY722_11525 [bacterium]|nr:hypothetical protein [bacterium]
MSLVSVWEETCRWGLTTVTTITMVAVGKIEASHARRGRPAPNYSSQDL